MAEEGANPLGIQLGRSAGLSDGGDGATHAKLGVERLEVAGGAGQGIEPMAPHTHQVAIALHGVPVQGKGVLVVVAPVYFYQKAGLDAPAVARAEVVAFMAVALRDGAVANAWCCPAWPTIGGAARPKRFRDGVCTI